MRVLLLITLACAVLTVAPAMPFMENVQQLGIIPVRAFSSGPLSGLAGLSVITALLGGSSSASASSLISTSGSIAQTSGASSGASSGPSSGADPYGGQTYVLY